MDSFSIVLLLPKDVQQELARLCYGVSHVDWREPDSFHITLCRLGHVESHVLTDIELKLKEIVIDPFDLTIEGVEVKCKKNKQGRILVHVAESKKLGELMKKLERELSVIPEFSNHCEKSPHVTLGTFQQLRPEKIVKFLEAASYFSGVTCKIEGFALVSPHVTEKRFYLQTIDDFSEKERDNQKQEKFSSGIPRTYLPKR